SATAGRCLRDPAVQVALHHLLTPAGVDESQHAQEPRSAALRRHALQKPQQLTDIILEGAALPGKAGRIESGPPAQRVPFQPGVRNLFSSSSVNGHFSAVPWTSTNCPLPVMTRFRSTSARESSA